ncbi:M48 family metalloprotease [Bacteroides sp. 51]|uniref:M48 family metalloprotease n=1 Tax=Bacteroides sp. 51 TaxID=2302938 RepID=UPI0013D5FDB0|nr:M48 family metalloprotease [Bacteroides sp. 51]NDV82860.1 hypothetical protein [Bacteroides sp. 51]
MKRVFLLLSVLLFSICSQAQGFLAAPQFKMNAVLKLDYKGFEKGSPVVIHSINSIGETDNQSTVNTRRSVYLVEINKQRAYIPFDSVTYLLEIPPFNVEDFWQDEYSNYKMPKYYQKKGYRSSIRQGLMADADEYTSNLNSLLYKDDYIQDYIQTIFNGIVPRKLDANRPERLTVEILQSPNPDAYMLPNGTLIISTGLLSTLDSVKELTAIIASEVAHYALDHHVMTVVQERARLRRAEIWGVVLVGIATGIEAALIENNENYIPGGLLITAGVAGELLTASAIDQLGMGYSNKQICDADDIAIRFLVRTGTDPAALRSALSKIWAYYKEVKDDYALSRIGGYGNIDQRINRLRTPMTISNREFQKKMAGVTTVNSIIQLNSKNYEAAGKLARKNIDNKLASDEDYYILIKANMNHTNSPEDNRRNLELIQEAKSISPVPNLGLYKLEILLYLRLDQQEQAIEALNRYMTMVSEFKQETTNSDDTRWANEEIGWGNRLNRQLNLN